MRGKRASPFVCSPCSFPRLRPKKKGENHLTDEQSFHLRVSAHIHLYHEKGEEGSKIQGISMFFSNFNVFFILHVCKKSKVGSINDTGFASNHPKRCERLSPS